MNKINFKGKIPRYFLVLFLPALAGMVMVAADITQPPLTICMKPDLTVVGLWAQKCTSCSCQCLGKTYSLSASVFEGAVVKIKNIGRARSGPCRLEISAEKGFFSSGPNANFNIPELAPGVTFTVRTGPGFHVFYNTHATGLRIHASIDFTKVVDECDEKNNMKVVTACEEFRERLI